MKSKFTYLETYDQLAANTKEVLSEKEKLLEHFRHAEEGISFFSSDYKNIYTNSYFIQYVSMLLNTTTFDISDMFNSPLFADILDFLKNPDKSTVFNKKIQSHGLYFLIKTIIFDDNSFEIIIRNISETEKFHSERSVITNNIAHEFRTPLTSIRGYLETLLNHEDLPPEKQQEFIKRAYNQVIRLSEITQDIVLLAQTETPQYFDRENVNIYKLLREMTGSYKEISTINIQVDKHVTVRGNRTLLHSIFYNLGDNAIKYAGENVIIDIYNYMEDDDFYYFSYSDNGKGIDEKYIHRIFERFYRIKEGRTRDQGGSGLGLSIVKEAVLFHKGEIYAKNKADGGLEFLFTLKKK
ncbi:hypothetical protein AGMMS50262_16390 [Bacteroidia bacterium]|nr:hypothetical protein AGMMS50262_16390 [Bacteroidia bacterium]